MIKTDNISYLKRGYDKNKLRKVVFMDRDGTIHIDKVETEIPNDSPTVEIPELKITRFIDINGVELKSIVESFVEKDSNIVYENEQYDYVNTTEENGIRTHVYKKHVAEEVPNNNTTTPTDNATTENKVIEHTAPTGDNMSNTLKLFALSILGLGFALTKRKGLRDE